MCTFLERVGVFFAIDDDFGRNREITDFLWIFRFKMDVFSGTDGKTAQNGCAEKKLEEISPLEQYVKNLQHALCFAKKSFSSILVFWGCFLSFVCSITVRRALVPNTQILK